LTDEVLARYNLNDRQKQAVSHAKVTGRINNAQYRDMTGISARTELRELQQLTDLVIFAKVGGTGQSAHYVIAKAKPVIGKRGGNPSQRETTKGLQRGQTGHLLPPTEKGTQCRSLFTNGWK